MSNNLRGALWILLAATSASGLILSIRALDGAATTPQLVFLRCIAGITLIYLFNIGKGGMSMRSAQWPMLLARGVLGVIALLCGFYVVTVIPLSTATVLFFTAPLWVTLLSVPFFGETIGWRRGLATLAGFLGAIIVLRPGFGDFEPAMLIALGSSVAFGGVLLMGKKLSKQGNPASTLMLYSLVMGGLASMPHAVMDWRPLVGVDWLFVAGVAGFGTLRTLGDTKGYAIGEASVMAPFQYTRLIIVAIAAYVFFDEAPDMMTYIGGALIIASSLYIAHREARVHKGSDGTKPSIAAP